MITMTLGRSNALYEIITMPLGRSNASKTNQRLICEVKQGFTCRFVLTFLDNVCVYWNKT